MPGPLYQNPSGRDPHLHMRKVTEALRDRHLTARQAAEQLAAERASAEPGASEGPMAGNQGPNRAG